MQPVGGGAPRPGRGVGFPGSRRQLDSAALLMLLVDADRPEPVRSGARELALFLTPEPGAEQQGVTVSSGSTQPHLVSTRDSLQEKLHAAEVEETVEGLLLRLEEFCSLADMAFVKMVGHHVSFLEAHVLQAERDHGALSQALRKWLGSSGLPAFGNKLWTPAAPTFELPALYRTEDYFPVDAGEATCRAPSCQRRL
ncbi:breast carcinoma-amplified sequence 4 isoform X5 [Sagmatias obliquidens]|uniref:breast carcinoma-amplified sequence 4 isoform X5 n=1 Tax=Sagmatias obliquidens TaxID=3371155 RepID=UPI000F444F4F|nr:breast carcinoma-amplified sequence 4 isoform X5 [Lagenorhynchus obliquidens]